MAKFAYTRQRHFEMLMKSSSWNRIDQRVLKDVKAVLKKQNWPCDVAHVKRSLCEANYFRYAACASHITSLLLGRKPVNLSQIKLQLVAKEQTLQECAICLDTILLTDKCTQLSCQHQFHTDCVRQWLREKTTCPLCRQTVAVPTLFDDIIKTSSSKSVKEVLDSMFLLVEPKLKEHRRLSFDFILRCFLTTLSQHPLLTADCCAQVKEALDFLGKMETTGLRILEWKNMLKDLA